MSLEVFRTNVLGPLLTTQAFLPLLKKGSRKVVSLQCVRHVDAHCKEACK